MIVPKNLITGDKIAIVSTAKKIGIAEIEYAIDSVTKWGLIPVMGRTIGLEEHQFAGTDQERAADFQEMLDDPDIRAIWCARGGYGTVRIIDALDFSNFLKNPKWIIGYSDITVLHSHVHINNVATLHSCMPIDFYKATDEAQLSLKEALFGKYLGYTISSGNKNRVGSGSGQLVGGNLSMLYSLCGSESAIDTSDKILCIEDLDEYLYHIDRMLQNLKRNGYFHNLAGLIVGGMTKMHDNEIPFGKTAEEIIADTVKEYDFPVVFNFPMGHVTDNRALVLGAAVSLEVSKEKVVLKYLHDKE